MRGLAILVRHGTEKYHDALLRFRELVEHQLPCVTFDIVIVDNALAPSTVRMESPDTTVIGSSNAYWEFSGWNAGVAYVDDRIEEYHVIVLVTSAFLRFDPQHLKSLSCEMIQCLTKRTFALGHFDYSNESLQIFDIEFRSWLRTSFLVFSPDIIAEISDFVSVRDSALFFSCDPRSPFKNEAPVSETYKNFIVGWLTGAGTGQGVEWHSRFELNEDTFPLFRSKSMAIFNEQVLSQRLELLGCEMFDITWLSRRVVAGGVLGPSPGWMLQIAGRCD